MNEIIYAGKHLITFSVSRHAHSSWEFIYCTSGSGRLSFDSGVIPYQTGDPALNLRRPTIVHDDGNHFILDAFTAAFYYFGSSPGKQSLLLSAYANLIVNLIANSLSTPTRNPIVEEIVKSLILSYPDENFELDQYLRTLPFNYDYLRKLFKNEVGVTPHQFLSDTRLQAAAERLSFTDGKQANISEVAHLCGFREPLYFSKIFRKKYGLSPSQYQRRQRESTSIPDGESLKIRP